MGRTPAVDLTPRLPPVATGSPPAPIVVAEGKDSPPVKAGRGGDKYSSPPSTVSPPRATLPPAPARAAARARDAVLEYLNGRLEPGDPSKSLAKAIEAVDGDALVQDDVKQRYLKMKAGVDPASFESRLAELTQNVDEAGRLQQLLGEIQKLGDIPKSQVWRGIAEIGTMKMRAAALHLSDAELHLSVATRHLANIKFAGQKNPAQEKKAEAKLRDAEAELRKAMTEAEIAVAEAKSAKTYANAAWTSARENAKVNDAEVKACADGYKESRPMQDYLDRQVQNVNRLLQESHKLLAQSANSSAGEAAEQAARQFHEAEVAWLDETHKMQARLARGSSEQSARHEQGEAAAEADAANREQEVRQERHTLHGRQVRAEELRAQELKDSLNRRDAADEAERRARKQARTAADTAKPD
jgi:hypothetical protein